MINTLKKDNYYSKISDHRSDQTEIGYFLSW